MKKHILNTLLLLIVLMATAFTPAGDEVTVKWLTFEEAVEKSKTEKKKIFIDVYTDWCGWCKVMDQKTFNQPVIAKYLNDNFYPVKFNAEQREDVTFRDTTFKFIPSGSRGYHQLAAALLQNKMSYPTVVFLDENFNLIQPLPGYQKPDAFEPILKYFGSDGYKTTDWESWQKTFESAL